MLAQAIKDLLEAGLTEAEIAARANTTQATINRIKNGQPRTSYDIGAAIMALHAEHRPQTAEGVAG